MIYSLLFSFLINAKITASFSVHHLGQNVNSLTKVSSQLLPEETQTVDPNRKSLSGIIYGDVLSGLTNLYPPEEISNRNAMSRTDGYWKYISKGEEPPQTLTYGEFDFLFFADIIDTALRMQNSGVITQEEVSTKTFIDIGSGTGRLVVGAAALHPGLKLCKGLEILPTIHDAAISNLGRCQQSDNTFSLQNPEKSNLDLSLAPIQFVCGSFDDPYEYFGDADIIFVFSTCFTAEMMSSLSDGIGRQCKPGTIIITTEYKLNSVGTIDPLENDPGMPYGEYEIDLVDSIDGNNWLVGGVSTAHVQRLVKSLWTGEGPRMKPKLSPRDLAANEAKESLKALKAPQQLSFEDFLKSQ